MKNGIRFFFIVLACFIHSLAFASNKPVSTPTDSCYQHKSSADIHSCLANKVKVSDRELNTVYQKLLQKVINGPEGQEFKAALVSAQKAWINYRDKRCDAEIYPDALGSLAPEVIDDCVLEMTLQKIEELRKKLEN